MDSQKIGAIGEETAARYLKRHGYRILDKNYAVRIAAGPTIGEVDIICKKNGVISFVEIKTLAQSVGVSFFPEDKVDFAKRRKIAKTAERWLIGNKIPLDSSWQIDVVAIEFDNSQKRQKISFFENIDVDQRS